MSFVRAHKAGEGVRIACIQHGDYRTALAVLEHERPEPYFGMRESVRSLKRLFAGRDALVISLDAKGPYVDQDERQRLVGLPIPRWCQRVPVLRWAVHSQLIMREIRRFRPTHLLLRTGGKLGLTIAQHCARERIPTLVVLANAVWAPNLHGAMIGRKFMKQLADPTFGRIYNYKPTACMSMVDYGLDPARCLPYEFGGERRPEAMPAKHKPAREDCHIVFAARMTESKGPLDIVDAVAKLRASGIPARATLFGEGEDLDKVRARAMSLPSGAVATPGWVDNGTLFETFCAADFVCVPTHPTFVEGMPMSLTEALASRTPVIASDCNVFARSFLDGEGVRLFKAQSATHLANVVREVWEDPAQYARLSEGTAAAFERVSAHRSFSEVLMDWELAIESGAERDARAHLAEQQHSPTSA
jgi:glycosyltransferase involved in cell wall biosynthesis